MDNYSELLRYIDPSSLDYQGWVNVGMALNYEGCDCSVWDEWSSRDSERYHPGDCARKWRTFGNGGSLQVTGATLMHLAKANGYLPPSSQVLKWDDEILIDDNIVIPDATYIDDEPIPAEPEEWNPEQELIDYLETVYRETDIIGYCTTVQKDDHGKLKPGTSGVFGRTAGELIRKLKAGKPLEDVIGTVNPDAGAWIRFNPLDGKGISNRNVTSFRHALVESDQLPLEKQVSILRKMKLPIAVMVYSGGKSVHAIVRINAKDETEYRERVKYLYNACKNNNLVVDEQNKNPARLSRMPGVSRGSKKQYIIDRNTGFETWDEWYDWIEGISDDYPDFDNVYEVLKNPPPLKPEIISGLLRRGHKMLIAGASKSAKSFALIELCAAFATGTDWLGVPCEQGKVLYINFELDRASCINRFNVIYKALGIEPDPEFSPDIWNLRGKAVEIAKLAPKLLRRTKGKNYMAVIFDPIYKINPGDENSAADTAAFCNNLDKLATEMDASVIFCHHHSKGAQGGKNTIDRASGSGVFARDPDTIVDMIEINPADVYLSLEDEESAWRVSFTLREFAYKKPIEVIFKYPLHIVTDKLADAKEKYGADARTNSVRGNQVKKDARTDRIEMAEKYIRETAGLGEQLDIKNVMNAVGVSLNVIKDYIKEMEGISYYDGEWIIDGIKYQKKGCQIGVSKPYRELTLTPDS